jgi:hypothetical protein
MCSMQYKISGDFVWKHMYDNRIIYLCAYNNAYSEKLYDKIFIIYFITSISYACFW